MRNYLRNLLFAGLVSLGGCADKVEDTEISRGEIGGVEVKLLGNVRNLARDLCSIEVYDADGTRRVKLQTLFFRDGFIEYDDGRIFEIRDGEYFERKKTKEE